MVSLSKTPRYLLLIALFLGLLAASCSNSTTSTADSGGDISGEDVPVDLDVEQDSLSEVVDLIEDSSQDTVVPLPSVESGSLTIVLENSSLLSITRGDDLLLRLPADAFAYGMVGELDDAANYDPWPLIVGDGLYTAPEGLQWRSSTSFDSVEGEAGELVLSLDFGEGIAGKLHIAEDGENRVRFHWEIAPAASPVGYMQLRPRIDETEGLYGLGEYFDQVNNRGKLRAMQMEPYGALESKYNEAHVPVPFVIGTTGWGLFVESRLPGTFDCATKEDDLLEVTFGTGTFSAAEGLVFYLMVEDNPLDLTRHYYEVTGYPRLPAKWALGPWVWRDENDDQAQVENDLQTIRDLDLATTGYWIDRPYATAVNTFDFKPSQFPDPDGMISLMHSLGFRTALWHTPYLDTSHEATADLLEHAETNGFFPTMLGILLNKWGAPVDLTNPDAFSWWQGLIGQYTQKGVEGFKLDYGEDIVPGFSGMRINVWEFFNGEDERTMQSKYSLYYHRAYAEMLPSDGGFLLCRHGSYGDQVNGVIVWPGDLDADFSLHGEIQVDNEGKEYGAVGGLPAALIGGLTLGPSGFPFYGSDTGGYRHSPPDEETFIRWFESTSVGSVMQIGTSSSDVAWEFFNETNDPDSEKLGWYRTYTRLHLRLFPYAWTYAQKLLEDGRPLQRPLGLAYPELGVHPSDHYLFGDYLLVAPVVRAGETTKTVQFAPGTWMDWFTGEEFAGNQDVEVQAPLGKLPLYIKKGGIVPLLRPTIDTTAPVDDPEEIDSYASDPGVLYPVVYPSTEATTFALFDGSTITVQDLASTIEMSWKDGEEFNQGALFTVLGFGATGPTAMAMDSEPVVEVASLEALEESDTAGWFYDGASTGTLYVKVPTGDHSVVIDQASE